MTVTHQSQSPTWLKRRSKHRVWLRDVQLYVFCQRYKHENMRQNKSGAFEIYFVSEEGEALAAFFARLRRTQLIMHTSRSPKIQGCFHAHPACQLGRGTLCCRAHCLNRVTTLSIRFATGSPALGPSLRERLRLLKLVDIFRKDLSYITSLLLRYDDTTYMNETKVRISEIPYRLHYTLCPTIKTASKLAWMARTIGFTTFSLERCNRGNLNATN